MGPPLVVSLVLVLDSEAFAGLAQRRSLRRQQVKSAVRAALAVNREVMVPAVVLAELYRGPGHNSAVDACLSRETGIEVRVTDKHLARYVGGALAAAGAGSEHLADAHVVAVAVERGGGTVLSTDSKDMEALAAAYPTVTVQRLP